MKPKLVKRKRKFQTVDWSTLKPGDQIKVIKGHGPYMVINGEKHRIGAPGGQYVVHKVTRDGIMAYQGINHYYIYMGNEKKSLLGFQAPHKIKKVLTKT